MWWDGEGTLKGTCETTFLEFEKKIGQAGI